MTQSGKAKRRWRPVAMVLAAVALAATAIGGATGPQADSRRMKVIGVLTNAEVALPAFDGFRTGMARLGWEQGRDVTYVFRGVVAGDDALATEARRLVDQQRADLILALTTKAALAAISAGEAAGKATGERRPVPVPVLFAPASNPVQTGLAKSLREPGGSATGVTFGSQEARRLAWLTRIVPNLTTVYVPYNRDDASPRASLPILEDAARKLGLTLIAEPVDGWEGMQQAMARLPMGTQAMLVAPDAVLASHAREIARFAIDRGIALTMPHQGGVEQGALMSYGFDLRDVGMQAANQGALMLSGVAPADLPVELAEFSLSINLATASRLGLTIPRAILRQARVVMP